MNFFLSQRPRKSPPAVMSTSRETPCILSLQSTTPSQSPRHSASDSLSVLTLSPSWGSYPDTF